MAETPSATLNGYRLLGSSPIQWVFTDGVQPYEATFDVMPQDIQKILDGGKDPQTLIIDSKVGPKVTVDYLSILHEVPSDNPHVRRIRVADRRWILPYFNFLGRFNMRRNVGYQRVGNNTTEQLNPVVPNVWYWPWSLKAANTPWKASEIVTEFMKQLEQWETNEGYPAIGFTLNAMLRQLDSKLSPDNLNIDESGDVALMRILSMYPATSLYVNAEGKYVFFDRHDRSENTAVQKLGPLVVGSGQFKKSNLKYVRPNRIEVFFTVEAEVRHDFIGDLSTVTEDTRWLENVAPVPDFELTVSGKQLAQGSWVGITPMMTAWGSAPGIGKPLDGQILEKAAMPYLDLWGALLLTGVREPDADWAARVAVLQQHHRKTFQLGSDWMMRTLSIKPRRCAVINPSTGTWAPSEAYCDHAFIGTVRSFFKNKGESKGLQFAVNVEGYPKGGQVPGKTSPSGAKSFTSTSKPAPVIVRVLDGDQGIIHLDFQADKNHMYEAALPGLVAKADNTLYHPTADWKDTTAQGAVGFDMVTDRAQIPKLKNSWKCAVILTHTPAAPNNKNQLYKIKVWPDDVKKRLNVQDLGECEGPTWQIRVGAGMDGAKALVRWLDSRATDIEALFGIGDQEPNLKGLVMNHDVADTSTSKEISLTEIAQALAAQVYSRFIDGQQGFGTGYLNAEVKPGGRVAQVAHTLTPKGEVYTEVQMHESVPEVPFISLLDSSTRAILLKLPHVERQ